MKTPSANYSLSLVYDRYVSGVARSKLVDSVYKLRDESCDPLVVTDFKNRLEIKINETVNEIKKVEPVKRGDKKSAQKLIRLLNKQCKYQWALDYLTQ